MSNDEIGALRARVAELESAKPICPMCAAKIDEAAGVDLAGLKQQLADVTKERDLAFGEIEASARRIDDLENSADIRNRELCRALHYAQQLREALELVVGDTNLNNAIDNAAKVLMVLIEEREARKCADKAVNDYRDLYLASQHYAQQLRDVLKNVADNVCERMIERGPVIEGTDFAALQVGIRKVIATPHDTSVLDALVKDAERYRWLRDNDACVLECVVEKRGFRSTAPNATRETWLERQGWTVSTLPITGMAYKTMDAAIDAARGK